MAEKIESTTPTPPAAPEGQAVAPPAALDDAQLDGVTGGVVAFSTTTPPGTGDGPQGSVADYVHA